VPALPHRAARTSHRPEQHSRCCLAETACWTVPYSDGAASAPPGAPSWLRCQRDESGLHGVRGDARSAASNTSQEQSARADQSTSHWMGTRQPRRPRLAIPCGYGIMKRSFCCSAALPCCKRQRAPPQGGVGTSPPPPGVGINAPAATATSQPSCQHLRHSRLPPALSFLTHGSHQGQLRTSGSVDCHAAGDSSPGHFFAIGRALMIPQAATPTRRHAGPDPG
jgi:hypothetical protein